MRLAPIPETKSNPQTQAHRFSVRLRDQSVTNRDRNGPWMKTPRPWRSGRSRRSDGVSVAEGGGFEPPRDVTPNTDSSRAP